MGNFKLIVFDLDGVIFKDRNFWRLMHKAYDTEKEGIAHEEKYLKTNYQKLVDEVIGRLWKGKPADKYLELLQSASYNPGVKETIAAIKKKGLKTAIISSSALGLVKRAQQELGIDYAFGNDLVIKDNKISGEFVPAHDFHGKGITLQHLCKDLGISPKEAIAVGDGDNDVPKFKVAGFSIAFNAYDPELKRIADAVVESDDLRDILPYIR